MEFLALTICPKILICWCAIRIRLTNPVAIYIEDGRGDFFDSFGRRPNADFERYINRHCSSWNFNDKQLQSVVSKFCGHYCIYFCILRSRGVDMCKIVRSFSSDTALNDVLVHAYCLCV